jgi:hypothetical protein
MPRISNYTIQDMKQIALKRGGKCLSSAYKNQNTSLEWLCDKCGNKWKATYASISIGHWCPKCAIETVRGSKIKYTINDMQKIAESRGGKCLSKIYLPSVAKIKWQCKRGHIWDAIPHNVVKKGTWCQKCAAIDSSGSSQRLTIEWFKEYAKKQGGFCLTEEYKNAKSILSLVCKHGHKWKTEARHISAGSWCHICGGSKRLDIEVYKEIAKERGGECLSTSYKNQRQKLNFKCENDHIFEKDGSAIKNTNQWCPECAQNTGERICKVAFEEIFKQKFNPIWPDWLRNSNNQPMELDGYK